MTNIIRIFGIVQLLSVLAAISTPASAMQLQVNVNGSYLCAVVEGGNTAGGTPVIAYPCSGGPEDQWAYTGGQLQGIGTANGSAMCLDVYGAGTSPGTPVDLWPCNGQQNQQWTVNGDLIFAYPNSDSPLCLDSSGGPSVGGGTQLVVNVCGAITPASQSWTLRGMQLQAAGKAPYLCANVQGSKTVNGTPVLSYSCNDAPNELWNSSYAGYIEGIGTENGKTKCLTAAGSTPGSLVSFSDCISQSYQAWFLGGMHLSGPLFGGLCLDRSGGPSVGGGIQLVVNTCSSAASQNWVVR